MRLPLATLSALTILAIADCRRPPELVICSYGGAFQQAQREIFFKPFEAATGIKVREAEYDGEYSKIKAMVDAGRVQWDLVDVESESLFRGINDGAFTHLSYKGIPKDDLFPEAISDFGVGADFYSTVLAFNTDAAAAHPPIGWASLWDPSLTGKRSLRLHPAGTLEIALLADGVSAEQLYPLDVPRALRKLDTLRPNIVAWWKEGVQPPTMLSSGEASMSSAWNGRIAAAKRAGATNIDLIWNQGLLDIEWWVIPRGAAHTTEAERFLAFATDAGRQAAFAERMSYGPVNRRALEAVPSTLRAELPTADANRPRQVFFNARWWATNGPQVEAAWHAWLDGSSAK
jgi:putative spermidine/putrescine transport system substrate-binding protein